MGSDRTVQFTKMQGTGNDFLVLDNRHEQFSRSTLSTLAAEWCPRRFGVGADGLLALAAGDGSEVDYRMLYVNADGSWATMCGNGARCLALFASRHGIGGPDFRFETDAGPYRAKIVDEDLVRLYIPDVDDARLEVSLSNDQPEGLGAVHYVNTGTEHAVAFVRDLEGVPVREWGRQLRADASFAPEGANANFVEVIDADTLAMRTFEKGVEGETLSCGTGVVAAGMIARRCDRVGEGPITVHTRGGTLTVRPRLQEDGHDGYLEGPAVTVYRGTIDVLPTV